jgi:hypothetical protein
MVKDEKGDLVTEPHSILLGKGNFSQLLNVQGVNDVGQTAIRTAEPLVSEPSAFEVGLTIEKLKRHKSPGIDQIPAELIKGGVEHFAVGSRCSSILFGIRRYCLKRGRSRSL